MSGDTQTERPFTLLIGALGGEGGGVLADWLVHCAREAGLAVQATSVPGVAQRTGATSYYLEWMARVPGEGPPVFALNPMPGCVDVVLCSEWLETARMIERGFVTPERTVLVSSTHRIYTTLEKLHMADGRYDSAGIEAAARALSRRCVHFDMEAIATRNGTVISAVMFGALAGAGVLPWSRDVCEEVVKSSGKGVQASLAGFAQAFEAAANPSAEPAAGPSSTQADAGAALAAASAPATSVQAWPPSVQVTAEHGRERCLDYQDAGHAQRYLDRVARLVRAGGADPAAVDALDEAARQLALWMSYEDVIRVADLKSRRSRFERVRAESQAQPGEIVHVVEYFKPGIDEIAAILPHRLGAALVRTAQRRGWMGRAYVGLYIRSTRLWGYLLLRFLARLRPLRLRSLRYAQEDEAIEAWLQAMDQALGRSPDFALALARLPTILKGYGDTHARGRRNYAELWRALVVPALQSDGPLDEQARSLTRGVDAALADPDGKQLAQTLERPMSDPARPVIYLQPSGESPSSPGAST